MAMILKPAELRVLGVLIEKCMTQPAYYPMTLNAITAAANQKSNRHPVMQLTEGEIGAALHGLTEWQLVAQAPPDRSSRVNRFRHEVEQRLGWDSSERAIMAELMLRGPQTVGELRTRGSRMTRLDATDHVGEVLAGLAKADPPMVVELPRQPGQSARRFAHLLGGEIEPTATASVAIAPDAADTSSDQAGLAARVSALEEEVSSLRQAVSQLQAGREPDLRS
ncbi:MAG: YceH family protein [Phycisphaerae bacterium]